MELSELYQMVYTSCVQFAVYQKKNISDRVKEILPYLNSFTNEFMSFNAYGIEEQDYRTLQLLLLDILKDLELGLNFQDAVILEDTMEYGLLKFLELFFSTERELTTLKEACTIE